MSLSNDRLFVSHKDSMTQRNFNHTCMQAGHLWFNPTTQDTISSPV